MNVQRTRSAKSLSTMFANLIFSAFMNCLHVQFQTSPLDKCFVTYFTFAILSWTWDFVMNFIDVSFKSKSIGIFISTSVTKTFFMSGGVMFIQIINHFVAFVTFDSLIMSIFDSSWPWTTRYIILNIMKTFQMSSHRGSTSCHHFWTMVAFTHFCFSNKNEMFPNRRSPIFFVFDSTLPLYFWWFYII